MHESDRCILCRRDAADFFYAAADISEHRRLAEAANAGGRDTISAGVALTVATAFADARRENAALSFYTSRYPVLARTMRNVSRYNLCHLDDVADISAQYPLLPDSDLRSNAVLSLCRVDDGSYEMERNIVFMAQLPTPRPQRHDRLLNVYRDTGFFNVFIFSADPTLQRRHGHLDRIHPPDLTAAACNRAAAQHPAAAGVVGLLDLGAFQPLAVDGGGAGAATESETSRAAASAEAAAAASAAGKRPSAPQSLASTASVAPDTADYSTDADSGDSYTYSDGQAQGQGQAGLRSAHLEAGQRLHGSKISTVPENSDGGGGGGGGGFLRRISRSYTAYRDRRRARQASAAPLQRQQHGHDPLVSGPLQRRPRQQSRRRGRGAADPEHVRVGRL